MACKWIVVVIITIVNETGSQEARIMAAPISRVAALRTDATFSCNGTGFTLLWRIDGYQDNHPIIIERGIDVDTIPDPAHNTRNSTLTVPASLVNNETVIQCVTVGSNGLNESSEVTLLIQGILAPPSNLNVDDHNQRFTWTPPFTLDITDVDPDITYSVCCNNCTITTDPYYDFSTLCDPVEFIVTAVNPVGESEPTSFVFDPIFTQRPVSISSIIHDVMTTHTLITPVPTATHFLITHVPTAIGAASVSIATTAELTFILGVTAAVLLVVIASSIVTCATVIRYRQQQKEIKDVENPQQDGIPPKIKHETFSMNQNLAYEDPKTLQVTKGPQPTDIEECPAYGVLNV